MPQGGTISIIDAQLLLPGDGDWPAMLKFEFDPDPSRKTRERENKGVVESALFI